MTERRPHWDDDLIDAVFRALSHTYRAQGWTGGIAIDLDESVYPLIAAVEDWHKAKRDSRILHALTWKRRLVEAEATIQRVRELHYNTATHHPSGCCSECGGTYPCPTVRALDGGAE